MMTLLIIMLSLWIGAMVGFWGSFRHLHTLPKDNPLVKSSLVSPASSARIAVSPTIKATKATHCIYCHVEFEAVAEWQCPTCSAHAHNECLGEMGEGICPTLGCNTKFEPEPSLPPERKALLDEQMREVLVWADNFSQQVDQTMQEAMADIENHINDAFSSQLKRRNRNR